MPIHSNYILKSLKQWLKAPTFPDGRAKMFIVMNADGVRAVAYATFSGKEGIFLSGHGYRGYKQLVLLLTLYLLSFSKDGSFWAEADFHKIQKIQKTSENLLEFKIF